MNEPKKKDLLNQKITCPICNAQFVVIQNTPIKFCPYCKTNLVPEHKATEITQDAVTIIHPPSKEEILFSIGPYHVLERIGTGGMGEVYRAYDTVTYRLIALKRIRPDLISHQQLHDRFLKESRITSQLAHPAIIPIYTIHQEENLLYYTMPYVEGKTLRDILVHARDQEKQGLKLDHQGTIPALIRIFLSVCQAVAYAHSKGIIHRDLKPNNIIVGRYGEVFILDWGLAKVIHHEEPEHDPKIKLPKRSAHVTRFGRIVGTVAYLAPERALGQHASIQTDVYALGVILYQILTLKHPFHRKSLDDFRKHIKDEVVFDPSEVAPYRDIPPALSHISLKSLAPSVADRYQTVSELVEELESYLEGRSEWFQTAQLSIQRKEDWEFQENVLLAEHTAIAGGLETEWVLLMISKASFSGNTRIEAKIKLGADCKGVGFLLSVPEAVEREQPISGYCLWVSSDLTKATKLLRSSVEVMYTPEVFLNRNEWISLRIEKIENNIYFYLNDQLQFSYISHLPLHGTHVGLVARDLDFKIDHFFVSVGSQNIMVNCLAIPDAFLAYKNFTTALSEYRRISYAFPGTAEAREALFRSGITLLEEARNTSDTKAREGKSEEALDEFEKLRITPNAPLEYIGKALVYHAMGDFEEEAKCFELAYRRYPRHPLLPVLQEQLTYRIYDSARYNRTATYQFILIALRHLPKAIHSHNAERLFFNLKSNWEPLYFINETAVPESLQESLFAIQIAFWLAKPYVLQEILDELLIMHMPDLPTISNALFALLELGAWQIAQEKLKQIYERMHMLEAIDQKARELFNLLDIAVMAHTNSLEDLEIKFMQQINQAHGPDLFRTVIHILNIALEKKAFDFVQHIARKVLALNVSSYETDLLNSYLVWTYLEQKDWDAVTAILKKYNAADLSQESSPFYLLYGIWLWKNKSKDKGSEYFSNVFDTPYPRSNTLMSHYLQKSKKEQQAMLDKLFMWEKRQLFHQLALFHHCVGPARKAKEFAELASLEYSQVN